jgi:hypothetical protein
LGVTSAGWTARSPDRRCHDAHVLACPVDGVNTETRCIGERAGTDRPDAWCAAAEDRGALAMARGLSVEVRLRLAYWSTVSW